MKDRPAETDRMRLTMESDKSKESDVSVELSDRRLTTSVMFDGCVGVGWIVSSNMFGELIELVD